ncbi:carboxylesterase/lipase family protein [Streptomyces erythrochromogenes]|uniref:carboxylesterase/lipase family protein n=1 Tax=Streptomyces erythrochromogenes TaxID=285574 RepID=UPI0033D342F1
MPDTRGVRRRCALLLPLVLLLVGAAAGPPDGPVVDTDRGPVRGRAHGAYSTFEGIPFSAPPTGPRRWRLPEPARRWEGVRDAGAPGSRCVQLPVLEPGGPVGSEDCLYLNVTAPSGPAAAATRPRPVMVWFHGGGFFSGSGDVYRPDRLVTRGDVVVVTVNYRLGVFGLFGHPELGGAPGFALADQRAALRWVRANAERFGGDPGNVTVFGESAGALSVCAHLTSPASTGLFHKAIVQSGSCSTTTPPSALLPGLGTYEPFVPARRTTEEGALAAARLGCDRPEGVLDCLRALDARALATPDLMQRFSFVPYGGGDLPTEPRRALQAGRFHRVPVLQGTTRDEVRLFLAQTLTAHPIGDEDAYLARMERSFGVGTARAVAAAYPVQAYPTPAIAWATLLTDASFICPTLRDGTALGRHVPTYGYRFSDRDAPDFTGLPPVPGLPLGAAHGFELPYLFTIAPLAPAQQRLADRMAGYWAAFARTGVPASPGAPPWPPPGAPGRVLSLAPGGDGIRVVDGRTEHHCALWDERWPGPGVTTAR